MGLLEREHQLAALDGLLSGVGDRGRGRLVMLAGEAGAGKTSLVRAFGERHRSVPVLSGGCEPLFTPRPLGPLLDIAADVGGELEAVTERGASATEVLRALARTVRAVSIVVLEDLHWADEATLDVVQLLGRRAARLPALVIGTYRDDELGRSHPLRVVLGGLGAVERIVVQPLSPAAVDRLASERGVDGAGLHARTGGNPFFVTEVLAHGTDVAPGSVRDAVTARAARLPASARRLLEAVAIGRPRTEIWLLESIAARELPQLERCLDSGMLRAEGDAVAFRHDIERETIEDGLPPNRRVTLHRAALSALEGRAEPARLAHHAQAAGDGAAVLAHSTTAGDRAARLGAHREAAAHLATALQHAEGAEPTVRAELLQRRFEECFASGMIGEAVEAATLALELSVDTGDRLREGEAQSWLSRLAWYQGDGGRVHERGAAAVEILESLPPGRELALAYGWRASTYMMDADLPGTREWGHKAIALAERLGETEVLVSATRNVGTTELAHGLPEGLEKLLRSLSLALESRMDGHAAVAYCNLVSSLCEIRDYDTALTHLSAGRAFCDAHDLLAWDTYLGGWAAYLALTRGRWAEAATLARENLDRTDAALPHSRFRSLLVVGLVHARRGDGDPWDALDQARAIAVEADELDTLGPVAVARAEARWLAGERDLVAHESDATLARARASDLRWLVGELEAWRSRAGLPHADSEHLPAPYRAELTRDVRAAAAFWTARGCRYDAALALAGSDVERDLRDSLRELQRLGARRAAAIVARRLRERGARAVSLGPRAATRANPVGLTARELDVLELLVHGDRNADIAAKLFLSEKTVDHHVSAILRKFSVRTRGQAAAAAVSQGITQR